MRLTALSALLPLVAAAQETPAAKDPVALDTLQVTAQRRVENAKDVPVAITAIQGEKLDVLGSAGDDIRFLAARVPSTDLRYFVIAVIIQRETGGNLGELLDNISGIIRARMKLLGQVKVLSAEGRMSAWVLGMLPFGAAAVIWTTNPQYLGVLFTDPSGRRMITVCLVMMALGALVMRRIIRIRV